MDNLVIHITLPKGLKLKSGAVLGQDTTFSVVGSIAPFYCSINQVKLAGGTYLSKLSDITVASMIYEMSKDADSYSYTTPPTPEPDDTTSAAYRRWKLWVNARQNWVVASAAKQLILNVFDLAGSRGSKTLGNFSINRVSLLADEGMPKRVTELAKEASEWLITIKSGGNVGPGGHVKGVVAQKGLLNVSDPLPGRLWVTTGMGANRKTVPGTGSEGTPVKYSNSPIVSWRMGRYFGNYVAIFSPALRPW